MSHMVRCGVLEARHQDRLEWLDETMDYMAGRYPHLGDLQLARLEMMGRQFLKPAIPHGREHTALTRDRALAEASADPDREPEAEAPPAPA